MGYVSRLNGYALRQKKLLFSFLACAAMGTLFNVLTPLVTIEIIDTVLTSGFTDLLVPYTLLFITLHGFYAVFDIIGRYGASLLTQRVIYNLRAELYDALMEKDLAFYDENETGQILARVTTDVTSMREWLFWGIRVIFIGFATLVGTYAVMWLVNPELTMYMLLLMPFTAIFIFNFSRRIRPVFLKARDQFGALSSVLAERIVGMKVIKSYAAQDRESKHVEKENRGFLNKRLHALRLLSFYRPLLPTVFGIAIGALIYFGGISFNLGTLTYGEFVGFVSLVAMLILPARFLTWGAGMYGRATASGERTFYILDVRDELLDPSDPVDFSSVKGEIVFDHVYFSYRGGNYILRDINFTVKPGQVVALLGSTGSGKTSLVNLIPRFYDADEEQVVNIHGKTYRVSKGSSIEVEGEEYFLEEGVVTVNEERFIAETPGEVLLNGVSVRNYCLDDLRSSIGMVHQDPFLFSASIRENIAFANPEASLEAIQAAAKAARIHDFIVTLDDGYDSLVGERGVTLSGGQKQRVAIARALLADPKILILDDSTSSVDAKTESMIQQALETLMKGRTTFIITHRLSTIRNANLIVMMERGRVVEMGAHEELLERDGLYAGIHETLSQMEAFTLGEEKPSSILGGVASE
jgi:ATP-binding cassette subfamily B protein